MSKEIEKSEIMVEHVVQSFLEVLKDLYGMDITNANFTETPKRVAKSILGERYNGINSKEECKKLLSVSFPSSYTGMIGLTDIMAYSKCPHHLENLSYVVHFGYIPTNKTVGLSKIARVIDLYAKQPLLQEEYTKELADIFMDELNPQGLGIIVYGKHDCMVARGIKQPNIRAFSSEMRGNFLVNSVKNEFLQFCFNKPRF